MPVYRVSRSLLQLRLSGRIRNDERQRRGRLQLWADLHLRNGVRLRISVRLRIRQVVILRGLKRRNLTAVALYDAVALRGGTLVRGPIESNGPRAISQATPKGSSGDPTTRSPMRAPLTKASDASITSGASSTL